MVTTLYIWQKTGKSPGHAALSFGNTYISIWPAREDSALKDLMTNSPKGNVKDFTIGMTHAPRLSKGYKIDRSIMDREATNRMVLNRLDTATMAVRWNEFKSNPARFNTRKANCSTLVATFLEIGSGVPYHTSPCVKIHDYTQNKLKQLAFQLRFLGNSVEMWSPEDVQRYALQIKSKLGG